jgi:hypothetical protein
MCFHNPCPLSKYDTGKKPGEKTNQTPSMLPSIPKFAKRHDNIQTKEKAQ